MPLIALLAAASAVAAPATISVVSVRDHGAIGDGQADDTAAFLDAVAEAQELHLPVYVPHGTYRVTETIALENIGLTGPTVGAWPADIDALPSVIVAHTDGPAFTMGPGASLSGVDLTYEWPAEPTEGPAAVVVSGIGVYISRCRIRYCWDGIMADGTNNVGRLNIEDVFIVAPRNVGVRVTGTWDVPCLRNVEVWNAGPVPRGLERGVGFLLGKNDLIRMSDCFAFAMGTGFLIEDTIEGCEIEGGTWGLLTGCSTDYCGRSVHVIGANTVSITGGTYWTHGESLLVEGEGARVRVVGAELKSNGAPCVIVRGGDHTVVTGCSLLRPMEAFQAPAVIHEAGRMVLSDNMVLSRGPGVVVGPGVVGSVVRGNIIEAWDGRALEIDPACGDSALADGNLTRVVAPEEPAG
jgi:hypothetical protein